MAFLIALPLLVYAFFAREAVQAFRAAAIVLVLGGMGGLASLETGEEAEDIVEAMPGVETTMIDEHEEQGEWAARLAIAAMIVALGSVVLEARKPHRRGAIIAVNLLLCAMAFAASARASKSGGEIRHEEARPGYDATKPPAVPGSPVEL